MLTPARENLVIVRAGDKSLHPQWLSSAERSWDIVVSYYGDHPARYLDQYDVLHLYKGSKWQGIADYIAKNRATINAYKYIWLPDDDLLTDTKTINRFFAYCSKLNLTLAQPALTPYSYYSWEITLQNPQTLCRLTDFVEIMAPCFKVETLHEFETSFTANSSGWGLEWVWRDIATAAGLLQFGIVDQTPVHHTRKVGSAGHGGSQAPASEMKKLLKESGLVMSTPRVLQQYTLPQPGPGAVNKARASVDA